MASSSAFLLLTAMLFAFPGSVLGERIADVRNTRHNLSATGTGTVKATSETQVCVFCHTPHGATQGDAALEPAALQPDLHALHSCRSTRTRSGHARPARRQLEAVPLLPRRHARHRQRQRADGRINQSIALTGTAPGGVMPPAPDRHRLLRSLGADLTNDHPISLNYTSRSPSATASCGRWTRTQRWPAGAEPCSACAPGYKPLLPLEPTEDGGAGQIQCATCHDPHIRETDISVGNQKFLRTTASRKRRRARRSRRRTTSCASPATTRTGERRLGVFGAPTRWSTQTYTLRRALREFPAALPVWKAACLNCHDTHTVQGARRLLRERHRQPRGAQVGQAPALESLLCLHLRRRAR